MIWPRHNMVKLIVYWTTKRYQEGQEVAKIGKHEEERWG